MLQTTYSKSHTQQPVIPVGWNSTALRCYTGPGTDSPAASFFFFPPSFWTVVAICSRNGARLGARDAAIQYSTPILQTMRSSSIPSTQPYPAALPPPQLRLYILKRPPLCFAASTALSGWLCIVCNRWSSAKEIDMLEAETGSIVEDKPLLLSSTLMTGSKQGRPGRYKISTRGQGAPAGREELGRALKVGK
ncbi:hypothetical protein BJV77DRAFT_964341 [Russula vinacea]|nr:hypothetical protein BJV77DRAFT_964341 [Russula vinacea]